MPLRMLFIMVTLVAGCLGVISAAWALHSETYIFLIGKFQVPPPPTPHWLILGGMVFALALGAWSPHYGLSMLTLITALIWLGTPVGYFAFNWTPGWAQYFLMGVLLATVLYGWKNEEYLDY